MKSIEELQKKFNQEIVLEEIRGFKFFCRKEMLDSYSCKEVFKPSSYSRLSLYPEDTVLDAGVNIGAFSVYAASKADFVVGFEPDSENYELAVENVKLNGFEEKVKLFNSAIIGGKETTRPFYLNSKKHPGSHSMFIERGRKEIEVSCTNINDIISKYKTNKIKMDVEGAEYEIIQDLSSQNMESIEQIIMEYHFAALKDKDQSKYCEILEKLGMHFSSLDFNPNIKSHWTTIIYARLS